LYVLSQSSVYLSGSGQLELYRAQSSIELALAHPPLTCSRHRSRYLKAGRRKTERRARRGVPVRNLSFLSVTVPRTVRPDTSCSTSSAAGSDRSSASKQFGSCPSSTSSLHILRQLPFFCPLTMLRGLFRVCTLLVHAQPFPPGGGGGGSVQSFPRNDSTPTDKLTKLA